MIFLSYGYGERVDKNSSVHPRCIRTVPVECLWHLMWCPRISHAVKASAETCNLSRLWTEKRNFSSTHLYCSPGPTPAIHTLHSSCYLSAVQRIPRDKFIAVSHNVIHTRAHTSSCTWSFWKVLSPGRITYVIMFNFRLYFNHYIIFEKCELRLYISPLSTFLVSSSPSFLLSTPVVKYFPSSRWEKAFPFRLF